MQTKLIKTKDYLLLLCEKAEIWGGEYIYNSEYQKIIKTSAEYIRALDSNNTLYLICDKILAHLPLNNAPVLEGVDLLPTFEEDNIEKKMFEAIQKAIGNDFKTFYKLAAKNCAEVAAQSKQFSLEDVKGILIKYLEEGFISKEQGYINPKTFLQSLSTQQLPKEFIPEYTWEWFNNVNNTGWENVSPSDMDAIIAHGLKPQPEFRKRLKTITNSQGQKVVQGEYKFE